MIRKDVIFAVLATFCLATVLFTVIPVGSYGTYDPWMDLNDDGKIDVRDIAPPCSAYGSTGNPTKNVTVTNLPLDENGNIKVTIQSATTSVLKTAVQDIVLIDNFLFWTGTVTKGVCTCPNNTTAFQFNFNPLLGFLQATHLYVSTILSQTSGMNDVFHFSIDANPNNSISKSLDFAGKSTPCSFAIDWVISDLDAGMHEISVFTDVYEAQMNRLEIFIEYEYMG